MSLQITGRHVPITERQRDYIEKKVRRLERHFERIDEVQFTLATEKIEHVAEINFRAGVISAFTKGIDSTDMLAAIDKAVDKLEIQITKAKEKRFDRKHGNGRPKADGLNEVGVIDDDDGDMSEN